MKLNLKSTIAAPADQTLNGIIGNTRRGIQVDQALDPDSNNPVANKPVSTALAALANQLGGKQDKLTAGNNITIEGTTISAAGGGSNINILTGSELNESDGGFVGTYSGVPDESKINVLHIDNFGDFVITYLGNGFYSGYVNAGDINIIISLIEGEYKINIESKSSKNTINIITKGDGDNTFNGTLVSPGLTLFSYKVQNQNSYVTIPVSSNGIWGTGTNFGFDNDSVDVYVFYEAFKKYGVITYHLKYYSHFITITNSTDNVALYLTIQNTSEDTFTADTLASYLVGKKVLANGNLHGVIPTYIAGEADGIKIYYMTPGDSNINPTPDEYQDLSSFTITDLVSPVE